jgi:hypothetical protein
MIKYKPEANSNGSVQSSVKGERQRYLWVQNSSDFQDINAAWPLKRAQSGPKIQKSGTSVKISIATLA